MKEGELDLPVGPEGLTIRQRVERLGLLENYTDITRFTTPYKTFLSEAFAQVGYTQPQFYLDTEAEIALGGQYLREFLIPGSSELPDSSRMLPDRNLHPNKILVLIGKYGLDGSVPLSINHLAKRERKSFRVLKEYEEGWGLRYHRLRYFIPQVVEFDLRDGRFNLERINSPKIANEQISKITRELASYFAEVIAKIPAFQQEAATQFFPPIPDDFANIGRSNSISFMLEEHRYQVTLRQSSMVHKLLIERGRDDADVSRDLTSEVIEVTNWLGSMASHSSVEYGYAESSLGERADLKNTLFSLEKAGDILTDLKAGK